MEDINFLHESLNKARGQAPVEILLVEDDQILGVSVKRFLEARLGLSVKLFFESFECIDYLSDRDSSYRFCLVTDISLKNSSDGLLLIDILKEKKFDFVSIVMTGFASVETAIAATKKGVYKYLTKPFELEHLTEIVIGAIEEKYGVQCTLPMPVKAKTKAIKVSLEEPKKEDLFCGMIGRSEKMKAVFERIQKVAHTDSTILITGPSGTGKELVANAIHDLSVRQDNAMISVNCGAIPGELLESELFGHMKGAFTGAISDRKGRFELANGGTIFLDEIGDMPPLLQVKLLRVLQQKKIEPVGGSFSKDVNVRIVAATHRLLEAEVGEGRFREDLYYRLNVIPIKLPALTQRREDIPLLISHFLKRFVSANGSNSLEFDDTALDILISYDWPGNVRELENLIERLVILKGGSVVRAEDLPLRINQNVHNLQKIEFADFELPESGLDLKTLLGEIEERLILQALEMTGGNKNQASKLLHLNRTTLIEKMKKKKINYFEDGQI